MASSSSSSSCLHHPPQWNDEAFHTFRGEDTRDNIISRLVDACLNPKWDCDVDVFVNFRGEDTRDNITSHLYDAMRRQSVKAFIDEGLERGVEVLPTLLDKIEKSLISLAVFSEDYVSSRSCLLELEKILECRKTKGQIVIPIFYRIQPSHVRCQTGTFGDAFVKHLQDPMADPQEIPIEAQKLRTILTEASYLSGWVSMNIRSDAELVEVIIKDILRKLVLISVLMADKLASHFDRVLNRLDSKVEAFVDNPDMKQLHISFREVHRLLLDARRYRLNQHRLLRLWFKDLRNLAYFIDELIDRFEKSEIPNRRFKQAPKRIGRQLIQFSNSFRKLIPSQDGERNAIYESHLLLSPSLLPFINSPSSSSSPTSSTNEDSYNLSGRHIHQASTSHTCSFGKVAAGDNPSLNLSSGSCRTKKTVLALEINDDGAQQKAFRIVSQFRGISGISFNKDKQMTIKGDIDAISIVTELQKLCVTELVYFGAAEEEGDHNTEEPNKANKKKANVVQFVSRKSKKFARFLSF